MTSIFRALPIMSSSDLPIPPSSDPWCPYTFSSRIPKCFNKTAGQIPETFGLVEINYLFWYLHRCLSKSISTKTALWSFDVGENKFMNHSIEIVCQTRARKLSNTIRKNCTELSTTTRKKLNIIWKNCTELSNTISLNCTELSNSIGMNCTELSNSITLNCTEFS